MECKSVFVGSIPMGVAISTLQELFGAYGTVAKLDYKKSFAFVDYESSDSAQRACELDGKLLGDKPIAVRLNTSENKKRRQAPVVMQSTEDEYSKRKRTEMSGYTASSAGSGTAVTVDPSTCCSIFVGGIPPSFPEEQLHNLFAAYGTVRSIELKKGFAFVEYDSPSSAISACELNEFEVTGPSNESRRLGVRLNLPGNKHKGSTSSSGGLSGGSQDSSCVFVGGLSPDVTETELWTLFTNCGKVASIDLKKGYAFAEFDSVTSALKACSLNGYVVRDKSIAVRINSKVNKVLHSRPKSITSSSFPAAAAAASNAPNLYSSNNVVSSLLNYSSNSVFIGGLPATITESEVRNLFSVFWKYIVKVDLKKNFAFIDFDSPAAAQGACALDGYVVSGKPIGVRLNTPENKQYFSRHASSSSASSSVGVLGGPLSTTSSPAPLAPPPSTFTEGATTVFVGGFPPEYTETTLRRIFAAFGRIVDIRVKKSFAFVDFSTFVEAQAACSMDRCALDNGRQLGVRININPNPPTDATSRTSTSTSAGGKGSSAMETDQDITSIFVGGLPERWNQNDIRHAFSQFGRVTDVCLKKGYAFVEFYTSQEAKSACVMNGFEVEGKKLGVRVNSTENKSQSHRKGLSVR